MSAKLITAKEIAERYSLHPKTVWKYARCGVLPVTKMAHRCVRFDVEKCDAALDRRTTRGSVHVGMLVSASAAILLAFSLAKTSTECQPFPHQRGEIAFLNRLSQFNSGWGHCLFASVKGLVTTILRQFFQVSAWEPQGAAVCA